MLSLSAVAPSGRATLEFLADPGRLDCLGFPDLLTNLDGLDLLEFLALLEYLAVLAVLDGLALLEYLAVLAVLDGLALLECLALLAVLDGLALLECLALLARLSTFETKASVLRGLLFAFLNYQIKVFTTPLRMPFAPLPS